MHDTSFAGLSRICLGAKAVTPVETSIACKVWPVANLKNFRGWIWWVDHKRSGEKCWHVHEARRSIASYCIHVVFTMNITSPRCALTGWQAQNTWVQKKSLRILARLPFWVYAFRTYLHKISIYIYMRALSAAYIALFHPWDPCTLSSGWMHRNTWEYAIQSLASKTALAPKYPNQSAAQHVLLHEWSSCTYPLHPRSMHPIQIETEHSTHQETLHQIPGFSW